MDNELLKKILDLLSMVLLLVIFSHFLACLWMLIGFEEFES